MKNIKTIFMIDDNEGDHFLSKAIIGKFENDVRIESAFGGEEALNILGAMEVLPDLILLDINMPRMDGHEFLAAYSERFDVLPPIIVMLTSSNQDSDREKASAFEFVKDYLVKPISEEKLTTIDKKLGQI